MYDNISNCRKEDSKTVMFYEIFSMTQGCLLRVDWSAKFTQWEQMSIFFAKKIPQMNIKNSSASQTSHLHTLKNVAFFFSIICNAFWNIGKKIIQYSTPGCWTGVLAVSAMIEPILLLELISVL